MAALAASQDWTRRTSGAAPARARAARDAAHRHRSSFAGARPVRASRRRSSARSPTRRCPSQTVGRAISQRRATSSRSATRSWPAPWRRTTSPPTGRRRRDPRRRLLPPSAVSLKAAASRAASLGSPDQAATYFLAAVEVTDDPAEAADLLEQAGVPRGRPVTRVGRGPPSWRSIGGRKLGDRVGVARAWGSSA